VNVGNSPSLSRRDRLRRVLLLCCSFARNVSFYRAGHAEYAQPLLSERHPEAAFWRQVNGNFLDIAVLDWCKLFGDKKVVRSERRGKHHWRGVVTDPETFERGLFARLQLNEDGFTALIDKMRHYRDEFVAHLDDGLVMDIPELEDAATAVNYYHEYVAAHEVQPGDLDGLPRAGDIAHAYDECDREAGRVYAAYIARAPRAGHDL